MAKLSPPPVLQQRADFQRLTARGAKRAYHGFVLQSLPAAPGSELRIGYTATKKLGNAVARNRARRRLREAVRLVLGPQQLTGIELVLVCRKETAAVPFDTLCATLKTAVAGVTR